MRLVERLGIQLYCSYTKALGKDTSKVEKVVELKFDGDVMKSYAVIDAAG